MRTRSTGSRRKTLRQLAALAIVGKGVALAACGSNSTPATDAPTRSYRMGFATTPVRPTVQDVLRGIDLWSQRSELAAIHEEVPWRDLLQGMSPDAILDRDKVQLVGYLRSKGLDLYVMLDGTDGLSRAEEAPQLRALGRSISEPAVQQAFRAYALALARKLRPSYLGLAAETNLVRAAAPAAVYQALVRMANDAAADLRAAGQTASLLHSVQVETAWGVLGGQGSFVGVTRDDADFPFTQVLGLSSYPYFSYPNPDALPMDYFSRLVRGRSTPVMVVEGGWTSASVGGVNSSEAQQARYVQMLGQLMQTVPSVAWIQLLYADLDLSAWPEPIPANLPLFTRIGLVDTNFQPKPALAEWDALHARRYVP